MMTLGERAATATQLEHRQTLSERAAAYTIRADGVKVYPTSVDPWRGGLVTELRPRHLHEARVTALTYTITDRLDEAMSHDGVSWQLRSAEARRRAYYEASARAGTRTSWSKPTARRSGRVYYDPPAEAEPAESKPYDAMESVEAKRALARGEYDDVLIWDRHHDHGDVLDERSCADCAGVIEPDDDDDFGGYRDRTPNRLSFRARRYPEVS